jgi:hypothetical protein
MKDRPEDEGEHAPSGARMQANWANAQLSTGPRTADGKARGARNALKHGAYAQAGHIPHGPLAEDPVGVQEFLDSLVADLAPRDHLELSVAEKISRICLREHRIGRLEHAYLGDAGKSHPAGDNSMEALERVTRLAGRVSREVEHALVTYALLRRRDLDS